MRSPVRAGVPTRRGDRQLVVYAAKGGKGFGKVPAQQQKPEPPPVPTPMQMRVRNYRT